MTLQLMIQQLMAPLWMTPQWMTPPMMIHTLLLMIFMGLLIRTDMARFEIEFAALAMVALNGAGPEYPPRPVPAGNGTRPADLDRGGFGRAHLQKPAMRSGRAMCICLR